MYARHQRPSSSEISMTTPLRDEYKAIQERHAECCHDDLAGLAGDLGEFSKKLVEQLEPSESIYLNMTDAEKAQLDTLNNMDDRAVVAENMLDNYHLLKTNLSIRQAIVKTLMRSYGPLSGVVQNANNLVTQAQAELDQCKYEILELMRVDS